MQDTQDKSAPSIPSDCLHQTTKPHDVPTRIRCYRLMVMLIASTLAAVGCSSDTSFDGGADSPPSRGGAPDCEEVAQTLSAEDSAQCPQEIIPRISLADLSNQFPAAYFAGDEIALSALTSSNDVLEQSAYTWEVQSRLSSAPLNKQAVSKVQMGGTGFRYTFPSLKAETVFIITLSIIDQAGNRFYESLSFIVRPRPTECLAKTVLRPMPPIATQVQQPSQAQATDLDGDGRLDVLIGSGRDGGIQWFRNLGQGRFSEAQLIAANVDGGTLTYAADLNNDSRLDVLCACPQADQVSWYRNDGGGDFSEQPAILNLDADATAIHVTDLNGDGYLDVLSDVEQGLLWASNNRDETFAEQQHIPLDAQTPNAVHLADFNRDGRMDILSASKQRTLISWYHNDGTRLHDANTISRQAPGVGALYAADFNGDELVDVLWASSIEGKIIWLRNDGAGGFVEQAAIFEGTAPVTAIYVADMNGDGYLDVVSSRHRDEGLVWHKNNGQGEFAAEPINTGAYSAGQALFAADLDDDGDLDLLAGSNRDKTVTWHQSICRQPPIAEAGVAQTVAADSLVTLDGRDSQHGDGGRGNLIYQWTPEDLLQEASSATPQFIAPAGAGNFRFALIVTDEDGLQSEPDHVEVTVLERENQVPTANAGPDQSVSAGDLVKLDGSSSRDSDGHITGYHWIAPVGILLRKSTAADIEFIAPAGSGKLTFELIVTDDDGDSSAPDYITISVDSGVPVATFSPTALVTAAPTPINTPAATPLSTPLITPDPTPTESPAATPSTTPDPTPSVTPSPTPSTTPTATPGANQLPTADAGPNQSVVVGSTVFLDASKSSDSDGTIASYAWTAPAGVSLSNSTASEPEFTAPGTSATLEFSLTVTDNDGGQSPADTVTISVSAPTENLRPIADAGPDLVASPGGLIQLSGSGNDPDGTIEGFQWSVPAAAAGGFGPGNSAVLGGSVPRTPGELVFTLVVTDDDAAQSSPDSVTVRVNAPPNAKAGSDQTVTSGSTVDLDGTASDDPDGSIVGYVWAAPVGISLSSSSSSMPSFTAPEGPASLVFSLTVTDNDGATSSTDSLTVTVNAPVNQKPIANAGPDQAVASGATVSLNGSASSDPEGNGLSGFEWSGPVALTGASSSTPTFDAPLGPATLDFSLVVIDDAGARSEADSVKISVSAPGNQPPVANAGADQVVAPNANVTLNGSGTDADGTIITYAWTAPSGVTLSNAGVANPSFTAGSPGTLVFSLRVTDDDSTTSTASTVSIRVNAPPTANAGPFQTVASGASVSLNGTASSDPDGSIAQYSWSVASGPAVTLSNANGATPSFTAPTLLSADTISLRLTVTDNDGANSNVSRVDVRVLAAPNQAPIANAGADQTVNAGVQATLNGSGSSDNDGFIRNYQWTQTSGPTVTLSGTGSSHSQRFTAPNSGTLVFKLTVTDDDNAASEDFVEIVVNQLPTADAGPDFAVFQRATVNLSSAGSSDPEGGAITQYYWEQTSGASVVLSPSASVASPSFTAPAGPTTLTFSLTVTDSGGAQSIADFVSVTVAPNQIPTADAGPDLFSFQRNTVNLSGAGSSDPDGAIASYSWLQTAGPAVALNPSNSVASPSFMAPAGPEALAFSLTVTDNDGATSTADSVGVSVYRNQSPTVYADNGDDSRGTYESHATIHLNASAYDSDGEIVGYQWTQSPEGTVSLSSGPDKFAFFSAPSVREPTSLTVTFTVTVTDNDGATKDDSVTFDITVIPYGTDR